MNCLLRGKISGKCSVVPADIDNKFINHICSPMHGPVQNCKHNVKSSYSVANQFCDNRTTITIILCAQS